MNNLILGFIFGVLLVGIPASISWNNDMKSAFEKGKIVGYIEGVQDCIEFVKPITPPITEEEIKREIVAKVCYYE